MLPHEDNVLNKFRIWKERHIQMRENRSSHLVGWKTHPTILPRPGIELTTSRSPWRRHDQGVLRANHSATAAVHISPWYIAHMRYPSGWSMIPLDCNGDVIACVYLQLFRSYIIATLSMLDYGVISSGVARIFVGRGHPADATCSMPPGRCHHADATQPCISRVHVWSSLGSWGSVSAPAVSRIMGGAQSEIKIANKI